jgi:hypothetical protein
MRDHIKGRRHQQALSAVERRKSLAKTSVYCHGFPPSMSQTTLKNYFSQFGAVSRVLCETQRVGISSSSFYPHKLNSE